jgi:hypothetical protein
MSRCVLAFALAALALAAAPIVQAQQPGPDSPPGMRLVSPGEVAATPEMWFYEQERLRYEDPQTVVRQKAEMKAAQRQARLASMKWFGFSNSRPQASIDPYAGPYSPRWTSNGYIPSEWVGVGGSTVVFRPGRMW